MVGNDKLKAMKMVFRILVRCACTYLEIKSMLNAFSTSPWTFCDFYFEGYSIIRHSCIISYPISNKVSLSVYDNRHLLLVMLTCVDNSNQWQWLNGINSASQRSCLRLEFKYIQQNNINFLEAKKCIQFKIPNY